MTKQEFTNRTHVEVSDNEFEAINTVYIESDLQKDEFCKVWCKMNASRVKSARVEAMIKERETSYKDAFRKWFDSWRDKVYTNYDMPIAYAKLSPYQVKAMSFAGIILNTTLQDIYYKVGQYLGIYNK